MEQLKLEDIQSIAMSDQGLKLLESFFPGDKVFSDVNIRQITSFDQFKSGFGLIDTKEGIRVSKRKYNLKNLLRFIKLNIENFKNNLYCISSTYDLIYYGYIPNENIGFVLIGKRVMSDTTVYYKQGSIDNTTIIFQKIQEWFDDKKSLLEISTKVELK